MDKTTDSIGMATRIIMVTGGQRSGKSLFAENMALEMSPHPTYLATARIFDEEMRERVRIHQDRRKNQWRNIEAPLGIETFEFSKDEVVLIDCLTLWATNWLFEKDEDVDEALSAVQHQLSWLKAKETTMIIVTNEIGLGGISPNALQRKFTDLQGMVNQYVGAIADEVYMIISGIPVKIKSRS